MQKPPRVVCQEPLIKLTLPPSPLMLNLSMLIVQAFASSANECVQCQHQVLRPSSPCVRSHRPKKNVKRLVQHVCLLENNQ